MNSAVRVLLAFCLGLGAGIGLEHDAFLRVIEPLGTLWINALRMPILPLIVTLTIAGIAKARDTREAGSLTGRAVLLFLALLIPFTALMTLLSPILLGGLPLDGATGDALRASAVTTGEAVTQLSFSGWLLSLIPTNPIEAAADGALLPLVIFSLLYGLALTRLPDTVRRQQGDAAQGIADVLMVLIRWILALAPIGVFALAYALGARVGAPAAAAVARYLIVVSLSIVGAGILLVLLTVVVGRIAPRALLAAISPALVIGISSRSSLAALPALITGLRQELRTPEPVLGVVVPLAASIFKFNAAITWALGAAFVAALYGVEVSTAQWLSFGVGTVLLSLTTPGIPSGGFLVQAPLYLAIGLPAEGLGILIAIDLIPDMFKTPINVLGYASAAAIAGRTPPEAAPA